MSVGSRGHSRESQLSGGSGSRRRRRLLRAEQRLSGLLKESSQNQQLLGELVVFVLILSCPFIEIDGPSRHTYSYILLLDPKNAIQLYSLRYDRSGSFRGVCRDLEGQKSEAETGLRWQQRRKHSDSLGLSSKVLDTQL